ncbi:mobility group protein 1B-like [Drosophila obscura]|uniref:mobility group protein 1B-like n=1 Tax=Drosophila obscura TaxID=7282 RepID=UPI000BA14B2F|nr:mobility group protein 1B-like [Drosophila obscura]
MSPRPKRPVSAYMLWLNTLGRRCIKQRYPHYSVTQVGRRAGKIWRQMREEQKDNWKSKASLAMLSYKKKLEDWKSQ